MSVIATCHLCQIKSDDVLEIFGTQGNAMSIAVVLRQHFWFDITESKIAQPPCICHECWAKVDSFHDFYQLVQEKHKTIGMLINLDSSTGMEASQFERPDEIVSVEHIKLEPELEDIGEKTEFVDSMDYEDAEGVVDGSDSDESSTCPVEATIKPVATAQKKASPKRKTERRVSKIQKKSSQDDNEDCHEPLDEITNKYITAKCDQCPVEDAPTFKALTEANEHYLAAHNQPGYLMCCDKRLSSNREVNQHSLWHQDQSKFKCSECSVCFSNYTKLNKHKRTVHPVKKLTCDRCDRSFKKLHLLIKHEQSHADDVDREAKKSSAEQTQIHDAETVRRFFVMQCDECGIQLSSLADARIHYQIEHKQNGYLMCCNKKYFKLYRIMQHCTWHINPDAFNCKLCNKTYTDGVSLRDHMVNLHSREEDKVYKCETCDKRFSKKHMLTSHHRLYHIRDEDKKFECHVCGQRFVILPFLRHHIKRVHDHAFGHICDICAKYFKCAQSYDLHYSIEHTHTAQKVQCEKCGKWLKHQKTLEKHMLWHSDGTETCKICGRVSANKRALRAHTKLAHTEPAYQCTVCQKKFKKKQTLKEHMAMHAGIAHLYTCTYCSKPFRSSANMYAHRKRAHPKEYADSKAAASSGL